MKILAIHPGALGDLIIFGHLIARIRGDVTLVAGREKSELLACTGIAQRTVDFNALPMHEIFIDASLEQCRLGEILGRHDRLISCFPAEGDEARLRLASLCGAADAAYLPVRPPEHYGGHLLELWCNMLDGLKPAPMDTTWTINEQWRDESKNEMARLGLDAAQNYFIIHPGAAAPEKRWPGGNFLQLGQMLRDASGKPKVIFVIGPVELDRWEESRIAEIKRNFPLLRSPALASLAGILAGSCGYVGNDCGVTHLAAAVGAPTVALFGPSNHRHFGPIGRNVSVIQSDPIENITADEVFAAMSGFIAPGRTKFTEPR